MQVFVINLERSADRRAAMSAQLRDTGLDVEFFTAIEGCTIDRSLYPEARPLAPGELGCYLSHVALWRRLADSDFDSALLLEDDVSVLSDLASICSDLAAVPLQIDMVRVSSVMPCRGHALLPLGTSHRLLLPTHNPSGTHGYWLTRRGARRLLARYATPRRPIDKQLDLAWQGDLRVLLLDPPAVRERADAISTMVSPIIRPRPHRLARKAQKLWRRLRVSRLARRLRRELRAARTLDEPLQAMRVPTRGANDPVRP